MSQLSCGTAASEAVLERVDGSTVGTLKVSLSDDLNEVASVVFYVATVDAGGQDVLRTGPYSADRYSRAGRYEKSSPSCPVSWRSFHCGRLGNADPVM